MVHTFEIHPPFNCDKDDWGMASALVATNGTSKSNGLL
ncbi:hypothetical protein EVA_16656 [gut metagenome]|uniref:Uncharacterized protein n=1 Tax=gut metagenome TaxID=749906 RepID=J9FJZ2_9ZZZZ